MPPWEKYQKTGKPWEKYTKSEPEEGFLAFANRSIVNAAGAPGDIYNTVTGGIGDLMRIGVGLDPMPQEQREATNLPIGSKDLRAGLESIGGRIAGEDAKPETLGEYAGRGAGDAASFLLPFGVGAKAMQIAKSPVTRKVGETLSRPFVSTPGRALTAETSAGAGAGAGEHVAENLAPDDPAARLLGQLTGGVTAAAGPAAAVRTVQKLPLVSTAIRGARAAIFPFTEAGGKVRASRRLRELAGDPEAEASLLEEPSIGNLTPAQRTGNKRLMALERSVLDEDAALDDQFKQRTAESSRALREAIRDPGEGLGAEEAREFIARRRDYLTSLLDQRVTQAAEAAQQRIARLEPRLKASESSTIVREELDKALRAARKQEGELWSALPDEAPVPTSAAKTAYGRLRDSLPRAQADDMPDKARRFLDRESNERLGDTDTLKEVHGLYSAMRESARQARAAGDLNEARISDEIADAILEDLGARAGTDTPIGRAFNDARNFSAELNEKFRRGDIGRVLGHAREGGASVPAETTLDVTVGRGGTRAAVSMDEIRRAVEGNSGDANAAVADYLRRRFADHTFQKDGFNASRAESFVKRNSELLDRFPELKREMQDAQGAQRMAERVSASSGSRAKTLRDPKRSRTAEFLNAPVEQEFETILRSRNPREAAKELRKQVSRDDTGKALAGLKGAFSDYLIRQARTADVDEAGQNIISGRKLQGLLNDPRVRASATELLNRGEFRRLERVVQELRNLETSQRRLPDVGGVMEDTPSSIISLLGRTLAARAGARAGQGASGASLLTAHFASQRMRKFLDNLTNDRAAALIRDAIQDPALFASLLRDVKNPRAAKPVERRLVEWLQGYTGVQASEATRE